MKLEDVSIHAWIQSYGIRTEKGKRLEFKKRLFLYDIYRDMSPFQVVYKAAQIGLSTLQILKAFWVAKNKGIDLIYTLPTDGDMSVFVGGKVNRIIKNNPILESWTNDKDTVEQKKIGDYMTYWRGTFSKRSAISVTSDLNIHDEVDFSDQEVIEDYESRLQASDYRGQWFFGHPSTEGVGVAKYWDKSDQKHWFIKCPHCHKEHFMKFPESLCFERKIFICKYCKQELQDTDRQHGRWVSKHKDMKFSGYWIPLLIAPWISAEYIIEKYNTKPAEFFHNRILGLPYVGSGNKVLQDQILGNLTPEFNDMQGRIVIGCDTGTHLRYVLGNDKGIFHYGQQEDTKDRNGNIIESKYEKIKYFLKRYPSSIVLFDQGGGPGDSTSVRELKEKYPGRVFLCFYREDRKTMELVTWNDEDRTVVIDRNKTIQLLIDEFTDRRVPLFGTESDYWDYWLHWDKIYRVSEETNLGTIKYRWLRSGRDDWVHATVYWRVGMSRFAKGKGTIYEGKTEEIPTSPEVLPGHKIIINPLKPDTAIIAKGISNWKIL